MRLLVLLLLCGCASQMTEADREYAVYYEQERVISYLVWERTCVEAGGHVFINNPTKPCRSANCIPHPVDWSHTRQHNRARCVR